MTFFVLSGGLRQGNSAKHPHIVDCVWIRLKSHSTLAMYLSDMRSVFPRRVQYFIRPYQALAKPSGNQKETFGK